MREIILSAHSNITISGDFLNSRRRVKAAFFLTNDLEVLLGIRYSALLESKRLTVILEVGEHPRSMPDPFPVLPHLRSHAMQDNYIVHYGYSSPSECCL
jgi:hypothetical protein